MKETPTCRACYFMEMIGRAKMTANSWSAKGARGDCMCRHPDAVETFNRVCPRSPRMAGFIGFTAPGESKPTIKTSPKWCPLRPENKEEKNHE